MAITLSIALCVIMIGWIGVMIEANNKHRDIVLFLFVTLSFIGMLIGVFAIVVIPEL